MCKSGCTKLCPCSLGLALGLTCGLGMFIWSLWLMYFGTMPMMAEYQFPIPSFKDAAVHSLFGLIKGFAFGFFVALFYDWIVSCCKKSGCCRGAKAECCSDKCIDKPKDEAGSK